MTERERLIELIGQYTENITARELHEAEFDEKFAAYLLENGVIVLPCKVGDTVYQIDSAEKIYESKVEWFYYDKDYKRVVYDCDSGLAFSEEAIGSSVYLSREEAEQALKERGK